MSAEFVAIKRVRLTDTLADRIGALIRSGQFPVGEKLPPIGEMARAFGVGAPSVRQALTKLETLGLVEVRHGRGVFVRATETRIQRMLIERSSAAD
jgi:GntR family transcriptional repressor for pyruvate dehydrogenase complex